MALSRVTRLASQQLVRSFATKPSASHFVDVLDKHFSPAVPRSPKGNNIVVDHAKGCWMYEYETGRKYLDFQTGIGVANTGHCHPRVVEAIQKQAALGLHLQQNCCISRPVAQLIEKLDGITPEGISRFFFNCTGTEACESAIKLARHETKKQHVISFKGGFHGRSLAALAMTSSKNVYAAGFAPFPPGFYQTPFPNCLHCDSTHKPADGNGCCMNPMKALRELMKETITPQETAAVIIEPILGEGGYLPTPPGYLRELRKFCDEHNIFLIVDEVQAGMGRTGKWWGHQHDGILPDVIVFAKGIASGLPLSGIATRGDYMLKSPSSSMGGTFGANAVSAAAACATIDVIAEENLLDNATARGNQLQAGLRKLQQRYPDVIQDVRGRGCMVGLEFDMKHVPAGFAGAVTHAAMQQGLLLLTSGWRECIRFIPPLVVSEAEMAQGIEMFSKAVDHAVATSSIKRSK